VRLRQGGNDLQSATTIEDEDIRELNCAVDSISIVLDMLAMQGGFSSEIEVIVFVRDPVREGVGVVGSGLALHNIFQIRVTNRDKL
jgi:hypothetical protein